MAGPGSLKDAARDFVKKYELDEGHEVKIVETLGKRPDSWTTDLRDLDHALSKARNPSSLLGVKLADLEKLSSLVARAQKGHLPGCMCSSCKESAFARAVGVGSGSLESSSLNAASLAAYQVQMDALNPSSEPPREDGDAFKTGAAGGAAGKKPGAKGALALPTGDLVSEVRSFCHRFNIDERLQMKVLDALKKRGEAWREDLADMNKALSSARNPSGMLCVKLQHIDATQSPQQLCFNYRAGKCEFGNRCRYSHDVATGAERFNSSALLEAGAKGTVAALPQGQALTASAGGGAGGFSGSGGFSERSDGERKRPRALQRRRSSSLSRARGDAVARSRSRDGDDGGGNGSRRQTRWD